jgi:hypothetical protein
MYRLIANITRCFFWLGDHFETALLVQSLLMIVAQVRPSPFFTKPSHMLTPDTAHSALHLHSLHAEDLS